MTLGEVQRAIEADDELLDTVHAPSDPELARALVAWRWWINATKSPSLVSTDTAVAVIKAAREEHDPHNVTSD